MTGCSVVLRHPTPFSLAVQHSKVYGVERMQKVGKKWYGKKKLTCTKRRFEKEKVNQCYKKCKLTSKELMDLTTKVALIAFLCDDNEKCEAWKEREKSERKQFWGLSSLVKGRGSHGRGKIFIISSSLCGLVCHSAHENTEPSFPQLWDWTKKGSCSHPFRFMLAIVMDC